MDIDIQSNITRGPHRGWGFVDKQHVGWLSFEGSVTLTDSPASMVGNEDLPAPANTVTFSSGRVPTGASNVSRTRTASPPRQLARKQRPSTEADTQRRPVMPARRVFRPAVMRMVATRSLGGT